MRRTVMALRRAGYVLCLLAGMTVLAAGCGGRHNVDDEPEADPNAPTPLTVDNAHWLDVVIFVFHDGEMSRVGTVTAASSTNFFLPIGATKGVGTELIHVQPGQFIEWRLESSLARSTVAVY
jgi:hypothetical protein